MHGIFRMLAYAALLVGPSSAQVAQAEDLFPPGNAGVPGASSGHAAVETARVELSVARLELLHARAAFEQVTRDAESTLRNGLDYRDLQRAAAQASARYYAVRRPIIYGLRRDADFLRLEQVRELARSNIRQLVAQQRTSYAQLLPYARQSMDAGRRMTRSETIALALEPAVEDARAEMTEAYSRLRSATAANREALLDHPGIAMAREEIAVARQHVADANHRLADALTAEADAERSRGSR